MDKLSSEVQRMVASLTTLHAALAKISGFGGGGGVVSDASRASSVVTQTTKAQERAAAEAERQVRKLMDVNRKATDDAERLAKKSAEYSMGLIRRRAEAERKAHADATKAAERAAAEAERQVRKLMAVNRKATDDAERLAKKSAEYSMGLIRRRAEAERKAHADATKAAERAAAEAERQARKIMAVNSRATQQAGAGALNVARALQTQHIAQSQAHTSLTQMTGGLFGAEIAVARLVRAYATLYAAMRVFRVGASEAVEFNAILEQSRLAIAATFLTFKEYIENTDSYSTAIREAAFAQQLLRVATFQTTATFEQLVAGFQKIVTAAAGSKATTRDMVDFTVTIANFAAATGQSFETVSNQFRTVLLGISRTTGTVGGFMYTLGVTPDVLRSWREQGTILENVQKRMQQFLRIGPDLNKTWAGAVSNLQDVLENTLGIGFKSALDAAKATVAKITDIFADVQTSIGIGEFTFQPEMLERVRELSDKVAAAISSLGVAIHPVIDALAVFIGWVADGLSVLGRLAQLTSYVSGPIKAVGSVIKAVGDALAPFAIALTVSAVGLQFLTRTSWIVIAPMVSIIQTLIKMNVALKAAAASFNAITVAQITLGTATVTTSGLFASLAASLPIIIAQGAVVAGVLTAIALATVTAMSLWEKWKAKQAERRAIAGEDFLKQTIVKRLPEPIDPVSNDQLSRFRQLSLQSREAVISLASAIQTNHQQTALGVKKGQEFAYALERIAFQAKATGEELQKVDAILLRMEEKTNSIALKTISKESPFGDVRKGVLEELLSLRKDIIDNPTILGDLLEHVDTKIRDLDPMRRLSLALRDGASKQDAKDAAIARLYEIEQMLKSGISESAGKLRDEFAKLRRAITKEMAPALAGVRGAGTKDELDERLTATSERLAQWKEDLTEKFGKQSEATSGLKEIIALLSKYEAQLKSAGKAREAELLDKERDKLTNESNEAYSKMIDTYRKMSVTAQDTAVERVKAEYHVREAQALTLAQSAAAAAVAAGDLDTYDKVMQAFLAKMAQLNGDLYNDTEKARLQDLRSAKKVGRELLALATTTTEGVTAAFMIMSEDIRTDAQIMAESIMGAFDSLEDALSDGFFAVMTGNFDDLGNVAKNFMANILKGGASNLAESIKNGLLKLISGRSTAIGEQPGDDNAHLTAGNRRDAQIGEAYNTAVQVAAAAYAGYNSYAMAKKSGKNGLESSGEGLMSTGAGLISVVPIVGIIVAALGIVAKILGVNSRKDLTETFRSSSSPFAQAFHGAKMPEDAQRAYDSIPLAFMTYMSSVFEAGASGSKANELIGALNASVIEYFAKVSYRAHAGSAEHLQADLEKILSTYAPRDLMRLAFGRTVSGPERPGVDVLGGPSGTDYFDPDAPIPLLLAGLGFTAAKIKQLSDQIDSSDPKEFAEKLKGLVEVVVGLTDLAAAFKGGAIFDALEADRNRTASSALGEKADLIGTRAATLLGGLLIPEEEQIARAKEIIDLAQKYYDEAKAAIKALQDKWAELTAQIGLNISQILDVVYGKGEDWLNADTRGSISRNLSRLGIGASWSDPTTTNLTPEQMAALAQETIGLVNQLFQSLAKQLQQAETTLAGITYLIGQFDEGYDNSATTLSKFRDKFREFGKQVEDAAKLTGKAQLDAIEDVRQSAVELYQLQQQLLQTIATNVEDLTRSIDTQIADIMGTFSHTAEGRELERRMQPLQQKAYAGTITDAERQQLGDLQGQYESVLGREQAQRSLDRIRELQRELPLASSPEAIRRITDEIQAEVGRYMRTFRADDPNRIAAAEDAIKILEETRASAKAAYAAMEAEIKTASEAIRKSLEGVARDLEDAVKSIKDQMLALVHVLESLNLVLGDGFSKEISAIQTRLAELSPVIASLTTIFTDLAKAIGGTGTGGGTGGGGGGKFDPEVNVIDGLGAVGQKATSLAAGPLNDMEQKVNRVNAALDALASRLEGGGGGGSSALQSADFLRQNPSYLRLRTR